MSKRAASNTSATGKKDMQGVAYLSSPEEMKRFLEFPYTHYADDPNWVPPLKMQQKDLLDKDKNPFFNNADAAFFLAYHNGKPAGRIAAIHNRAYNESNKVNYGFFGFFECIDNQLVADLLFRIVRDWLKERGCTRVVGPMNPGMLDEIGILVDGFEHKPAIMMPYSKKWYDSLLKKGGFKKEMDLFSYRVTEKTVTLDRLNRAVDIIMKRNPGLTIRPVNLKRFDEEVNAIHHIYNKAWEKNWGSYHISIEELRHLAKDLKLIIDTDIAHVAEIKGKPVAFSIALPDYNQVFSKMDGTLFPTGLFKLLWHKRKINAIRTALMGVLPEFQGRGIDALLTRESIVKGLDKGYQSAELGWLLESNPDILRVAEKVGGSKVKTYRIYAQELS
ncbi:hypothetical protein QLX67_06165 [Balneolaceae bacterium ANBcel3]|nr:hypothetical protein [Balneolaceae bacterium ANBcel3]